MVRGGLAVPGRRCQNTLNSCWKTVWARVFTCKKMILVYLRNYIFILVSLLPAGRQPRHQSHRRGSFSSANCVPLTTWEFTFYPVGLLLQRPCCLLAERFFSKNKQTWECFSPPCFSFFTFCHLVSRLAILLFDKIAITELTVFPFLVVAWVAALSNIKCSARWKLTVALGEAPNWNMAAAAA